VGEKSQANIIGLLTLRFSTEASSHIKCLLHHLQKLSGKLKTGTLFVLHIHSVPLTTAESPPLAAHGLQLQHHITRHGTPDEASFADRRLL
jgi:hypothetical protein